MSDVVEKLLEELALQRKDAKRREEMLTDQHNQKVEIMERQLAATNLKVDELVQARRKVDPINGVQTHPALLMQALSTAITDFEHGPGSLESFAVWYARYKDVFEGATELSDLDKTNMLMSKLHGSDRDKYARQILPHQIKDKSFKETIETLSLLFGKEESQFELRLKCFQNEKRDLEDFTSYAGEIKQLVFDYDITNCSNEQFQCILFVNGLKTPRYAELKLKLENEMILKPETTLDMLTSICKRAEQSKRIASHCSEYQAPEVNVVSEQNFQETNAVYQQNRKFPRKSVNIAKPEQMRDPPNECRRCGRKHWERDCFFKDKTCFECSKLGHKAGFCENWNSKSEKRAVHRVISAVTVRQIKNFGARKYITVALDGTQVRLQLDTASDITLISVDTWLRIGEPAIRKSRIAPESATKTKLSLLGEVQIKIQIGSVVRTGKIYVTDLKLNLLGIDWIESFQLWDKPFNTICNAVQVKANKLQQTIVDKFPAVFTKKLGKCTKLKAQIHLKDGAVPVFVPKRRPAVAALMKVEEELNRLEKEGIITAVDYSEWAAPIVCVRKPNGGVRLCGDYSTGLNDAVESHNYPLPLPSELYEKFVGSSIYSHLDCSEAYNQVEVDEKSSELLTINTHKGLYRVNRLQPGLKSAPGAYQQLMDTLLAGIDGAAAYLDDLIVFGKNEQDHQKNLEAVLIRLEEYGITLKIEKCRFFQRELKYLGRIVDAQGTRPDPEKVEAVKNMPAPKNTSQLRSYIGAVAYYTQFIPNMRQLRAPMDKLLEKDRKWEWSLECEGAFQKFKLALTEATKLAHYDPAVPITVAADASNEGLGAVLYHEYENGSRRPIAHASRALNQAEKNYSQIEKEGLALVFAVKKFHRYVFGREFNLETDHKPLLSIFGSKKGIPIYTANRLQRWALTLMNYNFRIFYTSTLAFGHADVLSRLISSTCKPDEEYIIACFKCDQDIFEESVTKLPVHHSELVTRSEKCDDIQKIKKFLKTGWPDEKQVLQSNDPFVINFFRRKDELQEINGCLFVGERIVIPRALQPKLLSQLHEGHPGITRMTQLARQYVYWPSIDAQIKDYVRCCQRCVETAKAPGKHTLESWPLAAAPWERVHIDYAGPVDGWWYLVIVDAYSKWLEVFQMNTTTTFVTLESLRQTFARYGLPKTLVSDNGRQFISEEFEKFCSDNGIEHLKTAPYHPQSNGQAERMVDTLKRALKKLKGGEQTVAENLQTFLRTYRSTPSQATPNGRSPAEEFLGRPVRVTLDLLRRQETRTPQQNEKQNKQFNVKHGAKERPFAVGELVSVMCHRGNHTIWAPGVVTKQRGQVNYDVKVDWNNGNKTRMFHANQIRTRYEPNLFQQDQLEDLFEQFELPPPPQMGGRRQSNVPDEQWNITAEPESFEEEVETLVATPPVSPTPRSRYGRPQRTTNRYQPH